MLMCPSFQNPGAIGFQNPGAIVDRGAVECDTIFFLILEPTLGFLAQASVKTSVEAKLRGNICW